MTCLPMSVLRSELQWCVRYISLLFRATTRKPVAKSTIKLRDSSTLLRRAKDDIAHGKTDRRQRHGAVAKLRDQLIVTSAARDGAKFSRAVKHLKHDTGIISKSANDPDIDRHKICQATPIQSIDQFAELLAFACAFQSRKDGIGKVAEFLGGLLTRLAPKFVNRLQKFVPAIGRHVSFTQKICTEFAVADSDDEIVFAQSERTQHIDTERDQLDVCGEIGLTDDVAVQLKMLPQTAALLFLVPEELTDRKPFERFLKLAFVCRD